MGFADSLRSVASSVYAKFGTSVTVSIISHTTYDTSSGKVLTAISEASVKAIISDVTEKNEKDTLLKVGDKKVKVAAADVTTKPSTKDRVKVNNVVLEIVDIRTTELEGKDITYEIYCRG